MLNLLWGMGLGFCVLWAFIFGSDVIRLLGKKRKSAVAEGTVTSCKMDKKWAYTAMDVKYDYVIDGRKRTGRAYVKSVLRPSVANRSTVKVYYEKDHPDNSFLDEQLKSDWKSILVLVVLTIGLAVTFRL